MVIDERELLYPPDSPLRAWRLFRVRAVDAEIVLSSPMYHDPDPPPWPAVGSVASCYEGHAAPAAGCRCGIYAAVALYRSAGFTVVRENRDWVRAQTESA